MIEEIVKFLEDGNWHSLTEIKKNFNMSDAKLWQVIEFLENFSLLNLDAEKSKAKLASSFLHLPVEAGE